MLVLVSGEGIRTVKNLLIFFYSYNFLKKDHAILKDHCDGETLIFKVDLII